MRTVQFTIPIKKHLHAHSDIQIYSEDINPLFF